MACSIWSLDDKSDTHKLLNKFKSGTALRENYMDSKPSFYEHYCHNDKLQKCLVNMKFYRLTEVQKNSEYIIFKNESGLICAPRGTGKSATILLIAFEEIISRRKVVDHPQIIILCKTLELAKQMNERAAEFTRFCPGITVKLLIRGKKNQMIRENIVIGTSEKVVEVSACKALDLQKIQTLIVDDADCVVPTKECIGNVMTRIRCQLAQSCRLILLSCTKTKEIADFLVKHTRYYRAVVIPSTPRHMKRIFLSCSNKEQKMKAVDYYTSIYKYPGQSIVICNSKEDTSQLAESCDLPLLNGNMKDKERALVIELFNDGSINRLVTTPAFIKILLKHNISLIFNFDQLLKDRKLNEEAYDERESMIGEHRQGIVVNVIEKEWASSIFKRASLNLPEYEIKKCEELFTAK